MSDRLRKILKEHRVKVYLPYAGLQLSRVGLDTVTWSRLLCFNVYIMHPRHLVQGAVNVSDIDDAATAQHTYIWFYLRHSIPHVAETSQYAVCTTASDRAYHFHI